MATTEPTSDSEQNSGFDFGNPESDHDVTVAYNWRYVDSLYVTEDGIKRSQDTDGYPAEDGNDAVQCSCGEEFDSVEEGRTHLKQVGTLSIPPLDIPRAVTWRDERTKIHNGPVEVEVVPNRSKALGKVVKGADYLVATAREAYHPPERFQFENWDPLIDGRLTWGDGSPLFRSRCLRRALGAIAPSADYEPARYTIHCRGQRGLFIEGAGTGIVVAHLENNDF
ncbi:hypothetical protein SAMN05216388_101334 [Halorientalis persicus]|uniref:Uncharacterized protein n=1 Tax=Halorientalis persicus TaxID=1367881 RepID=A0A1H8Q2A2_9EURY|nr:hypothetical protein [Halorientalis persicus]SEO48111.1 hypothetical protein SAMN05216388_101334 [Halorientalis persicus]